MTKQSWRNPEETAMNKWRKHVCTNFNLRSNLRMIVLSKFLQLATNQVIHSHLLVVSPWDLYPQTHSVHFIRLLPLFWITRPRLVLLLLQDGFPLQSEEIRDNSELQGRPNRSPMKRKLQPLHRLWNGLVILVPVKRLLLNPSFHCLWDLLPVDSPLLVAKGSLCLLLLLSKQNFC